MTQDESFPLTEIQYAYWVGRGPNFVLGNVAPHAYFELEGRRLDPDVLAAAWNKLIARHGMLRAVVGADGRQTILTDVPRFEIDFLDLSNASEDEVEEQTLAIRDEMSHRVYTAADWPLFDIKITRLPEHDRLHISLDLLMVDLASVAVLFSEWQTLCQNPDLLAAGDGGWVGQVLPPIDVSFKDYVLALEDSTESPRYQRSMEYWTSRANTLAPPPDLPLAKSPAAVHKPKFSHRQFLLPEDDWKRFQERAQDRGLTPTAVLAAAFADVLAAWSGTLRFTLNLTIFNRLPLVLADDGKGHRGLHPHLRRVVGDFTSICLLEMDTAGGATFDERVRQAQRQLQQDLRHRYVSALHALRERRRLGLQSGFDTMPVVFTSGLGTVANVTGPRDYFGDITYRISQTPQVWLDHQVVDITGELDLTWDVVEELFPENLLDDMFATYTGLVERLATEDESLWDTDIRVAPPEHQLAERAQANDTEGPVPEGLLHQPFLPSIERYADKPAVISTQGQLTYRELADKANAIAAAVRAAEAEHGSLSDRLVGITVDKGLWQVAAAYGIVLAGGAYLPVGSALPAARRHRLLADGEAHTVITTADLDGRLEWPEHPTRLIIEELNGDSPPTEPGPADPTDLAYVLFTSGSTGTPKGVMIEHRSALNTVVDINERFGVTEDDVLFGLADLGFDLSVYDLFGSTAVGATLVLPDPDKTSEPAHWAELMVEHGVTVWNSVPAQMQMLVEHLEVGGEIPETLRVVMMSGDWIPIDLPDRIYALWPDAQVYSLGGATEASIWSNYHYVDEVPEGAPSIPYGVPLRNQRFHVLDAKFEHCPVWVPGELYIAGIGLARGYWRDEDKTNASFVHHPATGERLYRTGDYGRYLPDGIIQFLGRRDGQVKISGHRIELGEVEAAMSAHPGVDKSVAVKSAEEGTNARLLGYVIPAKSSDADALYEVEREDSAEVGTRWQAVCDADEDAAPGPSAEDLLSTWEHLNEVHAVATGAAFRALGLPHLPGETLDPLVAIRSENVATRYERWLGRAVKALQEHGDLDGHTVTRELPDAIPEDVAAGARQALKSTLDIDDDITDWMLSLAGNLKGILTQDLHSAELYANDRTPMVYERLFGPAYVVATDAVRRLVDAWPADRPLRVLEVGAGLGTLTKHLLPLLPAENTEYVFTDISTFFTDRAAEAFAEYGFVSYSLYNLDSPPETQGFEGKTFDLVIAASVLHDMKHIRRSLRSLRSAIAPGGTLLLVEQTKFHPWFDLTMGLQQGFDGYEDTDLRGAHPLLSVEEWRSELADAGFADFSVLTRAGGPAAVGFDVLVARGPAEHKRFDQEVLRAFVGEKLPKHMVPARIYALDELPLSPTGKVDRGALAKADTKSAARGRPAKPPQTSRQLKLVEIWRAVLGLAHADLGDDFLEAGGDSLLAARLVANIASAFDVTIPVSTVLEYPTVEALDGYLEQILGPSDPLEDES